MSRNHCDPDGKEFDLTGTLHRPAYCTICLISFFDSQKGYAHCYVSCVCLDLSACTGTNAQRAEVMPAQSFHASIQVFKMLGERKKTAKCLEADASSSCTVIFARSTKLYCSSHHAVFCACACVCFMCAVIICLALWLCTHSHLSLWWIQAVAMLWSKRRRREREGGGGGVGGFNPFAPKPACLRASPNAGAINPSVSNGSKVFSE